jgi:hypothetical protein
MAAMTEIVRDRMREFGSEGQTGPKIETSLRGNAR